jgi:hypothetical protein
LAGAEALPSNTACHSQSDSKKAANGFRSHFDMMVTVRRRPALHKCRCNQRLPLRLLWQ